MKEHIWFWVVSQIGFISLKNLLNYFSHIATFVSCRYRHLVNFYWASIKSTLLRFKHVNSDSRFFSYSGNKKMGKYEKFEQSINALNAILYNDCQGTIRNLGTSFKAREKKTSFGF